MNGQVKLTWRMLHTISHSLMVHVIFLKAYIHFALMYTADHIFPVLPTKDLINEDRDPTTPYKLVTGMTPSILHFLVLFFTCVVWKATTYVETKVLNMCHQEQKCFRGLFVGISQHQKGYLVYVPQKWKIVSPYNFVLVRDSLVRFCIRHNHMKKLWI